MIIVKETLRSIAYTKIGFTFAILTTVFGLLLLFGTLQLQRLPEYLGKRISDSFRLIVFLDESASPAGIDDIEALLKSEKGVRTVQFLDKAEAKKLFLKKTGEDFSQILKENPLPESFRVELVSSLSRNELNNLQNEISRQSVVSDVIFEGEVFFRLQSVIAGINKYLPYVTVILLLAAFYLNYSTTRLSLEKRAPETEIMLLVGAKLLTTRLPVIFYGLLIALIALLISGSVIWLGVGYFAGKSGSITEADIMNFNILIIWAASGLAIGLFSGVLCASKIRLK